MKLSTIDLPAFNKRMKPEKYYKGLLQAGYKGLEMVAPDHIDLARSSGLEVLNLVAPGLEIGLSRIENHDNLIPRITDLIYLAGEKKIPNVVVFSGSRAGMSDALGQENVHSGLDELMQEALDNKVVLLFEMLNTFDYPDYMADRATFGIDLVTAVASPALRLLYDVYHMHRMREDYMEDLTDGLGAISHIHVAESPDRTAPKADGDIPYGKIIPKVLKAGYDGYWGVELAFGKGDPLPELKAAAKTLLSLG